MAPKASTAPKYETHRAAVKVGPGQRLAFAAGKGYFAAPAPTSAGTLGRAPKGGSYQTDAQGRTDTTFNKNPAYRRGPAATDAQLAQQQTSAAFAPIEQQLTDSANARGKAVQAAIDSYTGTLGDLMGSYAPTAKAAYKGAEVGQGAVDASLGASLHGEGASAQSDLAAKLAQIGADPATVARLTAGMAGTVQGAEGAQAAHGSAALSALLASGATSEDYGAKQPGLAGLFGLQATKQAQGQISSDLQAKLNALAAQEPGAVLSALHNIATGKASAAKEAFAEHFKLAQAKEHVDEFGAEQSVRQQNADTSATRAAQSALNSDRSYAVSLTRLGISEKSLQLRVAAQAFKAANGGFSQKDIGKFREQATAMAQSSLNGSTSYVMQAGAKVPVHSGGVPFFEALSAQLKKGIPVQLALGALDRTYPQNARPTDEALQKYLGPLTPQAVKAQVQVNAGTPGVAGAAITNPTALLTTGPKVRVIAQSAAARGLDPQAVLAVASMEGLSGGIGDNGHAFGPWQLNNSGGVITGMFPHWTPQQINDWAWSPQGISFALDHMAMVAKGLKGRAAIDAIVRRFERPAAPDPEVAGAVGRYGA